MDPFSQVADAILAALKDDVQLNSLVASMNWYEAEPILHRKQQWLPGDLPALSLEMPSDRVAVVRTSRATRFHLKYPLSVWVSREAGDGTEKLNLMRWRVLSALYAAGPDLGLPEVSRVSPGEWFGISAHQGRGKSSGIQSALLGERLLVEVDVWVSHRDASVLV